MRCLSACGGGLTEHEQSCPSAAQSVTLVPSHGAYSSCSSVNSPKPPHLRGTFPRGGRCPHCHLCLSWLTHIRLWFPGEAGNQEPASRSQDPTWASFSFPFASRRRSQEGHGKNISGSLSAEHQAGQEPVPHQGCFGSSRALRVPCCLIYIKRRIKFL